MAWFCTNTHRRQPPWPLLGGACEAEPRASLGQRRHDSRNDAFCSRNDAFPPRIWRVFAHCVTPGPRAGGGGLLPGRRHHGGDRAGNGAGRDQRCVGDGTDAFPPPRPAPPQRSVPRAPRSVNAPPPPESARWSRAVLTPGAAPDSPRGLARAPRFESRLNQSLAASFFPGPGSRLRPCRPPAEARGGRSLRAGHRDSGAD